MSIAEDRADIEKVLLGDVSAFEEAVLRWQGPLINLAQRFCRDRGRAVEMAQKAFPRAYRSLKTSGRLWRRTLVAIGLQQDR
jgi:RNA polymerase sigma-70 factor (ECF subfamily)